MTFVLFCLLLAVYCLFVYCILLTCDFEESLISNNINVLKNSFKDMKFFSVYRFQNSVDDI